MKIGGFAHVNGITFFGDIFKVKTIKMKDGTKDKIDWILPPRWLKKLEGYRLFKLLPALYHQWLVFDIKMKLLIGFTVIYYLVEGLIPIPATEDILQYKWYFFIIGILLFLFIRRKVAKLLRYHGAEHKVINCYIKYGRISEELVYNSPRFNKRCGTNLVAIFIMLYSAMILLRIESILLMVVLFIVAFIINKKLIQIKNPKWDKLINIFQIVTVWEPQGEEIRIAITCFNKLQMAHLIYQREATKSSRC